MTLLSSWLWPDVSSRKNAESSIYEAAWVMFGIALIRGLFTLAVISGSWELDERWLGFVDSAVLVATGLGIRRKSRAAAVTGVTLYVGGHLTTWVTTGRPVAVGGIALYILVGLSLIAGVRG